MGMNGYLAGQSFNDRADLIEQRDTNSAINQNLREKENLLARKDHLHGLTEQRAIRAETENEKYKKLLAKPLAEILEENENYKKAYEEQQEVIAVWMLSQVSMKKLAMDFAKKLNIPEEDFTKNLPNEIFKIKNEAFAKNDLSMGGLVSEKTKTFLEKHKKALFDNMKSKMKK